MFMSLRNATSFAVAISLLTAPAAAAGQQSRAALRVAPGGELRSNAANDRKAYFFGVNYTAPFAYSYRALRARGVDPRRAIDIDVAQMARLKLNGYRIHVWDREISDARGNLIENDHLELLDYLLAKLAENKIAVALTPIAWWGTGWPEPDPPTPGFSALYTKQQMNTDPAAVAASLNYIRQLLSHVNKTSKRRYVDDPNIVAIELFNEPKHDAAGKQVTDYVNRLAQPVRELGYRGPIFYNISEQGNRPDFAAAVCAADIQGVSYQWYPTGLVHGSAIRNNMLPNVREYRLPFAQVQACNDKAKMVYEFDAADVAGSYIYPAMALAFRQAGFQWATQFSYDPSHIADANTEYPTHYLNLLYTPAKAISLLIASELFRGGARGSDFEAIKRGLELSYADDRSQLLTPTGFFHSASTTARPTKPGALREIAGIGSSPLVDHAGNGAYFLDKIKDGQWTLELYPDVVEHSDPFGRVSLRHQVRQLAWSERTMRLRLPELGDRFEIVAMSEAEGPRRQAAGGSFTAKPGKYLLSRRRGAQPPAGASGLPVPDNARLPTLAVSHQPCTFASSAAPWRISADVPSSEPVRSVVLHARRIGSRNFTQVPMTRSERGRYEAEIPPGSDLLKPGKIEYAVAVGTAAGTKTFPGGSPGQPSDWDYVGDTFWKTQLLPAIDRLPIFTPANAPKNLLLPRWRAGAPYSFDVVPGRNAPDLALRFGMNRSAGSPLEPLMLRATSDASRQTCNVPVLPPTEVRFTARSGSATPRPLRISLVTSDGAAWGADVLVGPQWQEHRIALTSLKLVPLALLPSAYPSFQRDFDERVGPQPSFSAAAVEGIQVALLPGSDAQETSWAVELGEVVLGR